MVIGYIRYKKCMRLPFQWGPGTILQCFSTKPSQDPQLCQDTFCSCKVCPEQVWSVRCLTGTPVQVDQAPLYQMLLVGRFGNWLLVISGHMVAASWWNSTIFELNILVILLSNNFIYIYILQQTKCVTISPNNCYIYYTGRVPVDASNCRDAI